MSSIAMNFATKKGKKYAEGSFKKYEPSDPYYEFITDSKGRQKRVKRDVPRGLTKRDEKGLRKIRKRAHYLDKGCNLCGFRVGWTFFIGIIPGAGDVANIALNYTLVLRPAKKLDIPQSLEAHMFFNNAVSAGVGFVPIVGDVALAAWKANWRNAALLEEFLRKRGEENIAAGQKSGLSEMSDPQQAKLASKFIGVFGGTSTPIPPEGDAAVNGNGDSAAGTSASATVAATTTTDPKASTNGKHRKSHSLSRRKHDAQVAEVGAPQPSEAGATAGDSEAAEADEKNQNKNKNKLKFW